MGLEEQELRAWVRRGVTGQTSRRPFLRAMLGLGPSGPLLADFVGAYAPAAAQDTPGAQHTFTPTWRGGGGKLRLLFLSVPTMINASRRYGVDPQVYMNRFVSWGMAQKANNWTGRNVVRWANAVYDR